MIKHYKVLGLMSGSSLDGLDIAYCTFEVDASKKENPIVNWNMLEAATLPFSEKWQVRLGHLPAQSALIFAKSNTYFGYYMGELVNTFLKESSIQPDFIASHGHTIFHYPNERCTVQIGDGAALAATTGLPVVCDFRTTDIALDGEGTPLAPIADKYLFGGYDFYLNIGGIANISCSVGERMIAFDVGAANQVFNRLANLAGQDFDKDGKLAAEGNLLTGLYYKINQLPYFEQDYPKSLDNQWLQHHIVKTYLEEEGSVSDKLRTACEQLAFQVHQSVKKICYEEKLRKERYTMFLSGGGVFNNYLIACLKNYCPQIDFVIPEKKIIQFKEAALIALLGVLRMEGLPNCLASVTGAKRDSVGGAVYF